MSFTILSCTHAWYLLAYFLFVYLLGRLMFSLLAFIFSRMQTLVHFACQFFFTCTYPFLHFPWLHCCFLHWHVFFLVCPCFIAFSIASLWSFLQLDHLWLALLLIACLPVFRLQWLQASLHFACLLFRFPTCFFANFQTFSQVASLSFCFLGCLYSLLPFFLDFILGALLHFIINCLPSYLKESLQLVSLHLCIVNGMISGSLLAYFLTYLLLIYTPTRN